MKQEEKFVFDWRERQMSLECVAFLLVAGTMMAAFLILLGFTDRKLAPGGGLLLTVLVLLDLYAFDRFRKARITYEWTPAAVRLHGKWLEREISLPEKGACCCRTRRSCGQNCGKRWGRTCRNFRRSVRPGRSNKRKKRGIWSRKRA